MPNEPHTTCRSTRLVRATVRRCNRPAGHTGYHVVDDSQGRPEYYWVNNDA